MANRPQAKIAVLKSKYQQLNDLAGTVHAAMTAAVADFPTPVPPLATLLADATAQQTAIDTWGPVGNRGSHIDLATLRSATDVLYNDLLLLAAYVMNLVDPTISYADQTLFILSSGFSVKNSPSPQGVLNPPIDFIQRVASNISIYQPKLSWKRPAGLLSPGNVRSYEVRRSLTNVFSASLLVGVCTKTSFIDTTVVPGTINYYWVRGMNTNGPGVESPSVLVSIPN